MNGYTEHRPGTLYECLRCGHTWYGRTFERPVTCAGCKTPWWDRAKPGKKPTKRTRTAKQVET